MPIEPPPPYEVHGVMVPGRTISRTDPDTVTLSFHAEDAGEAEGLANLVQEKAIGRTVTYTIR